MLRRLISQQGCLIRLIRKTDLFPSTGPNRRVKRYINMRKLNYCVYIPGKLTFSHTGDYRVKASDKSLCWQKTFTKKRLAYLQGYSAHQRKQHHESGTTPSRSIDHDVAEHPRWMPT
jgi:hypothetical protein